MFNLALVGSFCPLSCPKTYHYGWDSYRAKGNSKGVKADHNSIDDTQDNQKSKNDFLDRNNDRNFDAPKNF